MEKPCGDSIPNAFARHVAACALRALMYELSTTPKPGLVDRANNGAHSDMDFMAFIDSACSLSPYFEELTGKALCWRGGPADLLANARALGVAAEACMLNATGGVNTHKGAIFTLGLLCLSAGLLHGRGAPMAPSGLFGLCAELTGNILADFDGVEHKTALTNGEEQYLRYGTGGVRTEAMRGFPSVRNWALPALEKLLAAGETHNDAGVVALLHLLARVQDSNIVRRSNPKIRSEIMNDAYLLLSRGQSVRELVDEARAMDERFIAQNISPGGCADLLALTWMVYFLTNGGCRLR